jgi:hypothetical protein
MRADDIFNSHAVPSDLEKRLDGTATDDSVSVVDRFVV